MEAPPIIDISAVRAGRDHPDIGRCAAAIDAACMNPGFFVATGHGLDHHIDRLLRATRDLFALPPQTKEAMAMADRRGYVPASHRALDDRHHSAPMEYYDVGFGPQNPWPPESALAGFADLVVAYQTHALTVAADVLMAIAIALDLDERFFADRMREPQCFLRMMHYEPRPVGHDGTPVVLTDEHTDYGLITLLATDDVSGLQIRPRGGEWTTVVAPPSSLVINLGDMLARWTNDRYVSTPHRATAPAERDRYSIPFFVNPDASTTVECLATCVTPNRPCGYEPVTAGDFLSERIAAGGYMRGDSRGDGTPQK